jgi:hypothetical protein
VTRRTARAVVAFLLAAGLFALPVSTAGAAGSSCCGTDCSPCPLSICKATRAERALVPHAAALAPLALCAEVAAPVAALDVASDAASRSFRVPRSFHPMRN